MGFVADASIVGAWLLDDEATPQTERLFDRYAAEKVRAPDVLVHEMRSIAVKAVRRKRMSQADAANFLGRFDMMSLESVVVGDSREILALALAHGLTAYDAAYLFLARSERLPLATLDAALRAAAVREGVALLPERV
jgi:predicted nucleic acid-binding protein